MFVNHYTGNRDELEPRSQKWEIQLFTKQKKEMTDSKPGQVIPNKVWEKV